MSDYEMPRPKRADEIELGTAPRMLIDFLPQGTAVHEALLGYGVSKLEPDEQELALAAQRAAADEEAAHTHARDIASTGRYWDAWREHMPGERLAVTAAQIASALLQAHYPHQDTAELASAAYDYAEALQAEGERRRK